MGRHDSTKAQKSKWFTSSSGAPLYATGLTGNKTVVQLSGANMEWVIKRYNQYIGKPLREPDELNKTGAKCLSYERLLPTHTRDS